MAKHFHLICLIIILLVNISNAQIIKSYGIKIGASNSTQNWEYSPHLGIDPSYISYIWGYNVGGYIEFLDIPYFSIVTELHYIERGRTFSIRETRIDNSNPQGYIEIGDYKIKQKFNYVSIPILAKLRYETPSIITYLSAGPSIDFLISYPESDVYKKFNKVEYGAIVTLGLNIPYGPLSKMIFEINYFINEGTERALDLVHEFAGSRDVRISGGAEVIAVPEPWV